MGKIQGAGREGGARRTGRGLVGRRRTRPQQTIGREQPLCVMVAQGAWRKKLVEGAGGGNVRSRTIRVRLRKTWRPIGGASPLRRAWHGPCYVCRMCIARR